MNEKHQEMDERQEQLEQAADIADGQESFDMEDPYAIKESGDDDLENPKQTRPVAGSHGMGPSQPAQAESTVEFEDIEIEMPAAKDDVEKQEPPRIPAEQVLKANRGDSAQMIAINLESGSSGVSIIQTQGESTTNIYNHQKQIPSNVPQFDNKKAQEKQKRYEEQLEKKNQLKFFFSLLVIVVGTFGLFFLVHESEFASLKDQLQAKSGSRLENLINIKFQFEQRISDFDQIEDEKRKIREQIIRAADNILSNGTSRDISKQEVQLEKMFDTDPSFTDEPTRKTWRKLGPFPLEKLLDDNRFVLDTRLEYKEQNSPTRFYVGQMINLGADNEHGIARIQWHDGDMYEGNNIHGAKHGYGRYIWNDGAHYIGTFKDGKMDGEGLYEYPDGVKHIGKFRNGKYVSEAAKKPGQN